MRCEAGRSATEARHKHNGGFMLEAIRLARNSKCVFALSLLVAASAQVAAQPAPSQADVTVFIAKKIVTMDPGWPTATAVAVGHRRIAFLGAPEQLTTRAGGHPPLEPSRQDQALLV